MSDVPEVSDDCDVQFLAEIKKDPTQHVPPISLLHLSQELKDVVSLHASHYLCVKISFTLHLRVLCLYVKNN